MQNKKSERVSVFSKNENLENLLQELSLLLENGNAQLLERESDERYTKVFVVGALRSGTTLITQWLAHSGLVAYPTNLLSRFYGAPLVGAKIQQLLTDSRYNFRNEILDFNSEIFFSSENGKTKGALAPNEFWYFWRRFLPFDDVDYLPPEELRQKGNMIGLRDELNALANIFERPFAMKAMIMNQNIPELAENFNKSLFIWIRRDPAFNIQSALEARKRQYGDINAWYSFKIKEYSGLKKLPALESVAGQIAAINQSVEDGLSRLPESQKLIVSYEDFCQAPEVFFNKVVAKMREQDGIDKDAIPEYTGQNFFSNTNTWRLKEFSYEEAAAAYAKTYAAL